MLEKGSYKGEGGEVGWEKGVWVGMTAPLSECSLGRKKKKEKGVGVARRGEKISLPLRLWLPVPVILNNELILMVVGQVPSSSLLARAPARTPMCTHPLPPPPRFPFAAAAAEPDCLVCNNLPSPPPLSSSRRTTRPISEEWGMLETQQRRQREEAERGGLAWALSPIPAAAPQAGLPEARAQGQGKAGEGKAGRRPHW